MAEPNIDHRVDIYAIGIMGYEMLTGHPAFEGQSAQQILSAHVLEQPKDVRESRPNVPPLLAEALLKCLAKNPADRWQSADELLAQLEQVATTPSGGITPTTTRPYQATPAKPKASGRRTWLIGAIGALVLAAGGGGAAVLLGKSHGIQRIAVLPIEDISGKDSLFVDAMQDALINSLSRLTTVGVASRSAMLPYKRTPKPTREVAKELGLDAVIETTVFRSGDVMRINMQFTDPVTTRSLWSDTYERNVKDVLAAQSEIVNLAAQAVANVLKGGGASR